MLQPSSEVQWWASCAPSCWSCSSSTGCVRRMRDPIHWMSQSGYHSPHPTPRRTRRSTHRKLCHHTLGMIRNLLIGDNIIGRHAGQGDLRIGDYAHYRISKHRHNTSHHPMLCITRSMRRRSHKGSVRWI